MNFSGIHLVHPFFLSLPLQVLTAHTHALIFSVSSPLLHKRLETFFDSKLIFKHTIPPRSTGERVELSQF